MANLCASIVIVTVLCVCSAAASFNTTGVRATSLQIARHGATMQQHLVAAASVLLAPDEAACGGDEAACGCDERVARGGDERVACAAVGAAPRVTVPWHGTGCTVCRGVGATPRQDTTARAKADGRRDCSVLPPTRCRRCATASPATRTASLTPLVGRGSVRHHPNAVPSWRLLTTDRNPPDSTTHVTYRFDLRGLCHTDGYQFTSGGTW